MQSCAERLAAIKARKQAMKQENKDVAKAEKKDKKFQAPLTTKLAKYTDADLEAALNERNYRRLHPKAKAKPRAKAKARAEP